MKKLIMTLIQSMGEFANVGASLIFIYILFATMGLHTYNGSFFNICRYSPEPAENATAWAFDPTIQRACSQSGLGMFQCPGDMYCGNNAEHPEIDLATDLIDERAYISYGITNFNNLGTSLLTVFQMINSDTWYPQLIVLMDVEIPEFGALYCILIIVVG